MKILVSHPTGNANVRAVLKGFNEAGILSAFCTTIAVDKKSRLLNILPKQVSNELNRRSFPVPRNFIKTFPLREIGRLFFNKLKINGPIRHEFGNFSVDAIYRSLDKKVATQVLQEGVIHQTSAVYAYEDGALNTFKTASNLGLCKLYDLPIGYWRAAHQILENEIIRRPEWAVTLTGVNDSIHKLKRKDKEIAEADYIFVASSFTKRTLELYPEKLPEIFVVPYGFPDTIRKRKYSKISNRKLKLLFVGGLSQRKGIAEVLEAVELLKDKVELTIIGNKPVENCLPLNEGIKKHKYISSLPHSEVLRQMRNNDILVFPSLFEGFGLVITEAMSQGTPVITTHRTCGGDIIKHNFNGWLIEPGNTNALVNQINEILKDSYSVEKVGLNALKSAQARPWEIYESEMVNIIRDLHKGKQ